MDLICNIKDLPYSIISTCIHAISMPHNPSKMSCQSYESLNLMLVSKVQRVISKNGSQILNSPI